MIIDKRSETCYSTVRKHTDSNGFITVWCAFFFISMPMPQGIDFDKVLEINPTVALATVYRSAAKTTESGLAQSKGVDLDDKAFLSIARKVMQRYELFTNIFDIY